MKARGWTAVSVWTCLAILLAGCAAQPGPQSAPQTIRIDPAALATSPSIQPETQWRVRIPLGQEPLVDHICTLCNEYALIEIRKPETWKRFCSQTGLDSPMPDFTRGTVVGLVAVVGEPVGGQWPTSIRELRLQNDGAAWIRGKFQTGVYRPLLVDSYCNLIYHKGLKSVVLVEINRRAYLTSHR